MKKLIDAVLVLCTALATNAELHAQDFPPVPTEVVQLSDRAIIVRVLGPQATNVIALDSDAGIIVIDTEVSPVLARAIRNRIEETFGRSDFAYVINTHHHGDHTYGNQVFEDAMIVGMAEVPSRMAEAEQSREGTIQQLTAGLSGLRQALAGTDPGTEESGSLKATISYYEAVLTGLTDGFRLTAPALTFNDRMELRAGDLTLELVYYGQAHSKTDILIFCPELNLVATGDIFVPGEDPYLDSERWLQLDRWLENLDRMLGPSYAGATLIPGHGDNLSPGDLQVAKAFAQAKKAEFSGKGSAFFAFRDAYEAGGLEAGLLELDELRAHPDGHFFIHDEFDSFVYRLMVDGEENVAVRLFEKLAALFPHAPNAFDSLGEAYLRTGDGEKAQRAFQRCIQLDPDHQNANTRLEELRRTG